MAAGGHICRRTGIIFKRAQLDQYGNISGKFSKRSDQCLGGDAITRLLQWWVKGKFTAILKMATVLPYLLTDRNHFLADTSRHWEEFICNVSAKFLQCFRRRCDNGENKSWSAAAILIGYSGVHNYATGGTTRASFEKIWPVISEVQ